MGEYLGCPEMAAAGYRVFHDFPGGPRWNIDHVVVGPSGVYAIETKTRSKRAAPGAASPHEAVFDGRVIRFPSGEDAAPLIQAQRNAQSLGQFLLKSTNQQPKIHAIVALPGWYVVLRARADVKVISGRYVPRFILSNRRLLDETQIKTLAHQIDQKCRDIEF